MFVKAILCRLRRAVNWHLSTICCAISFLTIVPMPRPHSESAIKMCSWLFPFVGLLIGALIATVDSLLLLLMPESATSAITVGMLAAITGGLHLDGLADLADAIGSLKDRRGQLEVMRDAHIGALGAASVCIVLLLKYALIASVNPPLRWVALSLAPMLGRYCAALSMLLFPYARSEDGIAFRMREHRMEQLIAATAYTVIAVHAAASYVGHISMWLCIVITILISLRLTKRFGGLTGDCYGATVEICETASLFAFAMLQKVFL